MPLKQRPADILIQQLGKEAIDIENALGEFVGNRSTFNSHVKQRSKALQRVLVHRVDRRQINNAKE